VETDYPGQQLRSGIENDTLGELGADRCGFRRSFGEPCTGRRAPHNAGPAASIAPRHGLCADVASLGLAVSRADPRAAAGFAEAATGSGTDDRVVHLCSIVAAADPRGSRDERTRAAH